jgi:hypothetical protein
MNEREFQRLAAVLAAGPGEAEWKPRGVRVPSSGSASTRYQSFPRASPPEGVQAAHQVSALMPEETLLTLPSARQTLMPPEYGVEARRGLQGVAGPQGRT